jgi:hypothetical protein
MKWVYKIAGIISVVVGAALVLVWWLLSSVTDPDGRIMFDDVNGPAGWGILLICAGTYLAWSKPRPAA